MVREITRVLYIYNVLIIGGLTLGALNSTKFVLTPDVEGMNEMCEW